MSWFKLCKKLEEKIPGGKSEGKDPDQYEKKEVEKGKDVEFEHSPDPDVAREIARDHLEEHPDYYFGLKHMEELLKDLEKRDK